MYKIYISERPLWIQKEPVTGGSKEICTLHCDSIRSIKEEVIHVLEEGKVGLDGICLLSDQPKKTYTLFKEYYQLERAGGGLVFNPKGDILSIFRRGYWDLPKGKLDAGESIEQCAIREVREETGLRHVVMGDFLHTSYHSYIGRKGQRILKQTDWFFMFSTDTELYPQAEEDIEQSLWIMPSELRAKKPIFKNIVDIIDRANA